MIEIGRYEHFFRETTKYSEFVQELLNDEPTILIYGPSHAGKTEYGHWLASQFMLTERSELHTLIGPLDANRDRQFEFREGQKLAQDMRMPVHAKMFEDGEKRKIMSTWIAPSTFAGISSFWIVFIRISKEAQNIRAQNHRMEDTEKHKYLEASYDYAEHLYLGFQQNYSRHLITIENSIERKTENYEIRMQSPWIEGEIRTKMLTRLGNFGQHRTEPGQIMGGQLPQQDCDKKNTTTEEAEDVNASANRITNEQMSRDDANRSVFNAEDLDM